MHSTTSTIIVSCPIFDSSGILHECATGATYSCSELARLEVRDAFQEALGHRLEEKKRFPNREEKEKLGGASRTNELNLPANSQSSDVGVSAGEWVTREIGTTNIYRQALINSKSP
jgi:hypothetical protein